LNREERRLAAMRVRRGIATAKELEEFQARAGGGIGLRIQLSPAYFAHPNGAVSTNGFAEGARILRRPVRRFLVGIRAWRTGVRAPTRLPGRIT
jgi:hypothetical protein